MHCGACEHPLVDHADLEQPCPRCGGAVLRDGHLLLLAPLVQGYDALDLGTGLRQHLRCEPSAPSEPTADEDALDALLQAHFPQLPSPAPPAAEATPPEPALAGSTARRWWRRVVVASVSAMAAAQVGFALAPVPIDYADHASASAGHAPLAAAVASHPAVQRCLAPYRRLPVRQSEHPALLTLERTPGMSTPHVQVRSTHPVLAGCLSRAAKRLPLPAGRYRVSVPVTET